MPEAALDSIEDRLLQAAVEHFGRVGLQGASTRAIAAAAGTTMSSITYYFGGKHGLYLAAARYIARQMSDRLEPALAATEPANLPGNGADAASQAVLGAMDRFAEIMMAPESAAWTRFIVREQMDPTAAFDALYDGVLERLVEFLSTLLQRIGSTADDAGTARLKAMAIIGQALAFRVARATVLRATDRRDFDPESTVAIRRIVGAHTGAILAISRRRTADE